MDYQQFIIAVKEAVSALLDTSISLQTHTTLKNNARERVGLTFCDHKVNLSPTIYLEEFYQHFQEGDPIEEIAEHIIHIYHEVKFEHSWNVHIIKNFDSIRDKIVYKLIHAQMNQTLLENMPHLLFLDFAVVFYVLFEIEENGSATIPITNELVKLWDTNLEILKEVATANTPKLLPPVVKPMCTVVEELLGHPCEQLNSEDNIMFVLTNPLRSFGAVCILYDRVLDDIGWQFGENFYLLPSSVHEMILIPESKSPCKEDLLEMVTEINETQVDMEEILSNQVYYYDREQKLLS